MRRVPGPAAVLVGRSVVRVAREGPDGEPRVVEVPVEPGVPLPVLLRGLVDPAHVVVGAEAAAAGRPEVVVVDAGAGATEVSLVRDGRVVARRSAPGGDRMDAVVVALLGDGDRPRARRVREALSLQDVAEGVRAAEVRAALRPCRAEVVRAVVAVAGRPDVPVLLVGGGARSPDLAGDLDAAGLRDVVVAPRPEAAAVLAAPARPGRPLPVAAPARPRWLPDPPPRRRRAGRAVLAAGAAAVVLAALHVLGGLLAPAPGPPPPGVLAQYGYRFALPEGWAHTGGLPERRRSLLTPVTAPEGSDLIAVEATPLGYDAAAEPARAAAELRTEFDAAGPGLSGYAARARFGGRAVTAYRERAGASVVDWYVLLDGGTQLSVGCRHTPTGTAAVAAACAVVVGTLRGG